MDLRCRSPCGLRSHHLDASRYTTGRDLITGRAYQCYCKCFTSYYLWMPYDGLVMGITYTSCIQLEASRRTRLGQLRLRGGLGPRAFPGAPYSSMFICTGRDTPVAHWLLLRKALPPSVLEGLDGT